MARAHAPCGTSGSGGSRLGQRGGAAVIADASDQRRGRGGARAGRREQLAQRRRWLKRDQPGRGGVLEGRDALLGGAPRELVVDARGERRPALVGVRRLHAVAATARKSAQPLPNAGVELLVVGILPDARVGAAEEVVADGGAQRLRRRLDDLIVPQQLSRRARARARARPRASGRWARRRRCVTSCLPRSVTSSQPKWTWVAPRQAGTWRRSSRTSGIRCPPTAAGTGDRRCSRTRRQGACLSSHSRSEVMHERNRRPAASAAARISVTSASV